MNAYNIKFESRGYDRTIIAENFQHAMAEAVKCVDSWHESGAIKSVMKMDLPPIIIAEKK